MSNDITTVKEAIPLIGVGVAGAAIRSINHHPFSVKETAIRLCTAGFTSSVALMLLSASDFSRWVQGGIVGIVGVMGVDLLDAVRTYIFKQLTGEAPEDPMNEDPPETVHVEEAEKPAEKI